MSHIIAGDPAPTNPTARDRLIAKVAFGSDRYEADFLAELDAYRAEVRTATLEEADEDLVRLEQTLRRLIEDQKAAKARWRARAEKAEELVKNQRAEVLAEAIKAANAEYQPQDLMAPRTPYNEGVSDAVSALYRLRSGGESCG